HVGGFSDPMCDCLLSKARLRADQIEPQSGTAHHYAGASHESGWSVERPYSVLLQPGQDENKARKTARQYYAQFLTDKQISPKSIELAGGETEELVETTKYNPENGSLLTEPREFNLMFKTHMGASADDGDESSVAYLRPETAQSIFVQFKNVAETNRVKLPFGIAQIGKSFRNEINPRNYTFRSREFEQMEIEFFCRAEDGMRLTDEWLELRLKFYEEIGIPREHLHILDVPDGERAHYSKKTYDIEYEFPFGIQELEGVAYRTDYDLSKHQEHSGKPLELFDEENKEKLIPHVVEPSAGCDRTVLALICEAYEEETITDEKGKEDTRIVMRFSPRVAPIKVGVFPLLKNKPELVEKAREVQQLLSPHMTVFYDETAAIGRRYRRQDEVGTPFCVTIDFDTLGENGEEWKDTVTLRHRDSMEQERIAISELRSYLLDQIA
ncbi:MAG: glycine--tRNA ligase, partial [Verrucomicrobiota bacterium]